MYVYELVPPSHKDFGMNHKCDLQEQVRAKSQKPLVMFIGSLRKDWVSGSAAPWEDCTVYDVYIEPSDEDPDETVLLVQFAGGDGCNFSMPVGMIERLLAATNGSNERAMTYAYALRLLQHHRYP